MKDRFLSPGALPLRRQAEGYCIEGPGFYVWDEDPREVSEAVRDLGWSGAAQGHPASRPRDERDGS